MSVHRIAFAAMIFTLAACASATAPNTSQTAELEETKPDPRRGEEVKRLCFTGSINGFGETTKTSVVVTKGTKQYLVTTRNRCSDLNHAQSLKLNSFDSCLDRGDRLIGLDSAFGFKNTTTRPFPCYVDKIYEWDRKAKEADPETDAEEAASEEA